MEVLHPCFSPELLNESAPLEEPDFNCPHGRSGHRIVMDGHNLILVGGYSEKIDSGIFREVWCYNAIRGQWLSISNDLPRNLASHAIIKIGNDVLIYGGSGFPFGFYQSDSIHAVNLVTREIRKLSSDTPVDDKPTKRYGHSMYRCNDEAILFGGTQGHIFMSDMFSLNLRTLKWKKIEYKGPLDVVPTPRYRHEILEHDGIIYLFAGGTSTTCELFSRMPVFDMKKQEWSVCATEPDPKHGYPSERRCHSVIKWNNHAYICGGVCITEDAPSPENHFDDLWMLALTIRNPRWTRLAHVSLPRPLYFHSAAVTKDGCMYVYGGCYMENSRTKRTGEICRIWLTVPRLDRIVWQFIHKRLCSMFEIYPPQYWQISESSDAHQKTSCHHTTARFSHIESSSSLLDEYKCECLNKIIRHGSSPSNYSYFVDRIRRYHENKHNHFFPAASIRILESLHIPRHFIDEFCR